MLAVILSAGVGRRLAPLTHHLPKALLEVGGRPLLLHTLEALQEHGVREVVLVVGHLRDQLYATLSPAPPGLMIHWVVNDCYDRTGSLYSLWLARNYLTRPFIFMDADLLFNPRLLAGWVRDTGRSSVLVAPLDFDSGEEVKVTQKDGQATAIGKTVATPDPVAGEAVGIVKITAADLPLVLQLMDDLIGADPGAEHEELSQSLCDHGRLWVHSSGGLSWLEIDFPEDVQRAREVIWPAIQRELAGGTGAAGC